MPPGAEAPPVGLLDRFAFEQILLGNKKDVASASFIALHPLPASLGVHDPSPFSQVRAGRAGGRTREASRGQQGQVPLN